MRSPLARASSDAGDESGRKFGHGFSAGLKKVSGVIATGAAVGFAAAGAGLVALGGFGLKAAADFEQTRIAFEGILGDKNQADVFIDKLREFAKVTPFELPQLTTAARQLLAVGNTAEQVIPIMETLGNQAAALGVGGAEIEGVVRALGQMKGKGKVSAEELRQISEQFPGFSAIDAIAKSMGVSVADAFKLIERGAVSADDGIAAILQGMQDFPGAAGAMERQSKTLNGVISTFKDTVRDALINGIEPFLPAISSALAKAGPAIGKALAGAITAFASFVRLVQQNGPKIQKFFEKVAEVVRRNWPEIKKTVVDVMESIRGIVTSVISIVTTLWENFGNNILTFVQRAFGPVVQIISGAFETIRGLFQTFAALLRGDWAEVWDGLVKIVSGVFNTIIGFVKLGFEQLRLVVGIALEVLGSVFKGAWEGIKNGAKSAFDAVVGFFRDLPGRITGFISSVATAAADLGRAILDGIVSGITGAVGFVTDIAKAIANAAIDFINDRIIDNINDALEIRIEVFGRGVDINPPDIPHIPNFDTGGVVPGPRGAPVLAVVHGGEEVLTPAQRGRGGQTNNFYGITDTAAMVAALARAQRRQQLLAG